MKELMEIELSQIYGGDKFWGNVFTGAMGGAATGLSLCTASGPAYVACVAGFTIVGGGIGGWNT